jgi:hypothetical protein
LNFIALKSSNKILMIDKISSICVPKNLKLETKVKRLCVTLSTQTTLKILCETLCKTLRDFVLQSTNLKLNHISQISYFG